MVSSKCRISSIFSYIHSSASLPACMCISLSKKRTAGHPVVRPGERQHTVQLMDESGLCIESAQSRPPKVARIGTCLATMKWLPAGIAWHWAMFPLGTWQKGDRMQPHQKMQWNLGYWLLALLALTWAQSVWQTARTVEAVPYSAFEQALADGRVAEVIIGETTITGTLKTSEPDGKTTIVANRVEGDLVERLSRHGVPYRRVVESPLLRDLLSWIVPGLVFVGVWFFLIRRVLDRQGAGGFMSIGKSHAKVYVEKDTGVRFADVAGVDEAKAELQEIVTFLKDPQGSGRLGARLPGGVLLVGPPGTGKTLLAKAVAGEAGVPFFSISGSEFVEMFVGVGASRVRDLFTRAKKAAPAIVVIDLPDIADREEILKVHAIGKPISKSVSLRNIAERTPGFSGADLANLLNEAAILTVRRNKKEVTETEVWESIDKVLLGPEKKSRVMSDQEREMTAYHEAGNAVVGHFLPNCDPIRKVSIIGRGLAGGYTLSMPEKDIRYNTMAKFKDDLAMMLGGYVTEKLIYGDDQISTGPSSDLKKATQMATAMVMRYGMSEKLGQRQYGDNEEFIFLAQEIHEKKNYSEKTAEMIDGEINKLLDDAIKVSEKIIKENKDKMDGLVKVLMEKEIVEQEDFNAIMSNI